MSALAWLLLLALTISPAAAQGPVATSIQGTITLHGCLANVNEFNLQAKPTSGADPNLPTVHRSGGGATRARILAGSPSGRQFSFEIPRLASQQAYLLDVQFLSQTCGKVFWSGLGTGRAYPGQPLEIHGYAARTRVEILGVATRPSPIYPPNPMAREKPQWVGADILDFTDPADGIRRLRVQTDLPNITSIVLQIANRPFPTGGPAAEQACVSDDDVVRAVNFPVSPGRAWTELPPINFNELIMPTRRIDGGTGIAPAEVPPDGYPEIDPNILKELLAGAPLYMRVIPVTDGDRHCDEDEDGVAGWIKVIKPIADVLADLPPEGKDMKILSAFYKAPVIHPWPILGVHQYCVRVTKEHQLPASFQVIDPYGIDFVFANPKPASWTYSGWVNPGEVLCYYKSSGGGNSFFDVASGLVTGLIDGLGNFVNSVSALWEKVKATVVSITADVINEVGIECEDACKGLLTTGLNIALASAGIPPSIPNTAQLKEDAKAWVAAQVADQSGIPGSEVLASEAFDIADKSLTKYFDAGGGGQGLPDWLTSDIGLEPAILSVNLERVQPLLADQSTKFDTVYPPTLLTLHKGPFFEGQSLPLPRKFWTKGSPLPPDSLPDALNVPIALAPNLDKVPANKLAEWVAETSGDGYWLSLWNKDHWAATLTSNPCTYFPMDWFKIEGSFPYLKNIKHLGTLGNNVLWNGDFGPGPLNDPAQYNFCQ